MLRESQSSLQPFVDRLTSHSILSDAEQQRILDLPVRRKQVQSNQDFLPLGQRTDHACFVVEGLVGRFDQNSRGDRQITALYIVGDMPDLHSMLQPRTTCALQALSTSTILEVPHTALRAASASRPAIAEAFWRDCMVDSTILAQWLVNVGRRDAKSRLAHLLCEMAWRYKAVSAGGKIVFELPMTQCQLADATGLTSVHVNRVLKALRDVGTRLCRNNVRIDDWNVLVEIGDFDPAYLQSGTKPEDRIRTVSNMESLPPDADVYS